MKKQKVHQAINILLSALLVFSIFLTNIGQIIAYAQEAHSSVQDEEKTNKVTEINEEAATLQVEISDEEEQNLQNIFDEIYAKLNLLLNDEQGSLLGEILVYSELSDVLKEAIIFHETNKFEEAIPLYEDILFHLNEITEKEDTEIIVSTEMIKLIENFTILATERKSLFEYEDTKDKDLFEEDIKEMPSPDALTEQEIESAQQEKTSLNQSEMDLPIKEKASDPVLSEKEIKYEGRLARPKDGINTKPYGVAGYETIRLVGDLVGKRVSVTKEAVTSRATWAYIRVSGTDVSGWVDKKGINIETVTSQKDVLYEAELLRASDGINTKPFGTEGYETIQLVGDLVGQQVRVTKEATTSRTTWAYVEVLDTGISGWIDIQGIKLVETILSEKEVKYEGKLVREKDGINTKPYGVAGYETIRLVGDLVGKRVSVTKEAVTSRATWVYVNVSGTNVSGWIDKAGVEADKILLERKVNYRATLKRSSDGINTRPYGVEGYESIRLVDDWVGKEVHVTKEAITSRATWAYIEVIGTGISGWIDKKGLTINRTVYLDPGHGGSDSGASYSGVYEKNLNLAVSLKVRDLLEKSGYNVVMSRTTDETVGLYDRPAEANESGADILVSLHHNAMPGNSLVTGIETYHYKYDSNYPPKKENLPYHNDSKRLNDSLKLSNLIQSELVGGTGANNRGVKGAAFVVVREAHMPAVLLELGYMTSPSELKKLQSNSYQNKMAKAVFDGIDSYFR